jgi:hypothetical protein
MATSTHHTQSTPHCDSQAIYQQWLNVLIHYAKQPAFKADAWNWAKQLDADETGMWRGITNDLIKAMENEKEG